MPSDPGRLRQVQSRIGQIKATEYPVVVGGDKGYKIVERQWKDMPEPSKLAILQDIDWSGVTNCDRGHILLGEIDSGKISDAQRNTLIDMATSGEPVIYDGVKLPSPEEAKALFAEWTADYAAAKERDIGLSDILRATRSTPQDTRSDLHRMLDEAGERGKTQSKEQDRGGRER